METEMQNYPWDICIDADSPNYEDVIMIDLGDTTVYLTKSDLTDMLEAIL